MKKPGSATDPLWYKDAIIYELHVRAFADSNNDGIGDLRGLISRLDYLQDLGVTCLWLLPFFPSPLRDDGYDIANYTDVNPSYGTLEDFREFLNAAHQRNMQVMIELVINHTSDQHPWFQAARRAPAGSAERAMYVWSDSDQLYKDARIIFTDTEKSNWTWDDTAQAYYWHRFFSHQPDLNFDNPRVLDEVLTAMRFWLDMGVDALRMDAIPYLVERANTSCENLPETHAVIRTIRAAIDAEYSNRLILAEANQWPADVRPYFGEGDECHMAFHFPLMPRIYMALRQEDRLPITEIMAQTPEIPASCQWGLFLRNHDELTLEMVTDDERDYMYLAYSADPRMRINVGIRRRLAPLVDNNRRRIELLNSLLLSFPGTPVLYYGDEIGMGDNIYLGDRNGVRTPMQWNTDRNAGFSRCDPARLYFPVVMDPIYGYQVVNVEMQLSDQSSLLHWTRNMIALRKLFQVFGRGSLEFLHPENRKILAYLRRLEHADGSVETVLCVANLSRFAQPASLDLSPLAGMVPVEMLGYVRFPAITEQPYPLTLAPYSCLWLELQTQAEPLPTETATSIAQPAHAAAFDALLREGWSALRGEAGAEMLQGVLPGWLQRQRWFAAKGSSVQSVRLLEVAELPLCAAKAGADSREALTKAALCWLEVQSSEGVTEQYQLPLAIQRVAGLTADDLVEDSRVSRDEAVLDLRTLLEMQTAEGRYRLQDATSLEEFRQALLQLIVREQSVLFSEEARSVEAGISGAMDRSASLQGRRSPRLSAFVAAEPMPSRVGSAEQSNTSLLYGDRLILKLFRRLQPGIHPEVEIGRHLTEFAPSVRVPALLGSVTRVSSEAIPTSAAVLQELVQNEGDGWRWALDSLAAFFAAVEPLPLPMESTESGDAEASLGKIMHEVVPGFLEGVQRLGQRTAELHLALGAPSAEEAFAPEAITAGSMAADASQFARQLRTTLGAVRVHLPELNEQAADQAATVLSRRVELQAYAEALAAARPAGERIRVHGDFHLGQVLRSEGDFYLLDFEGEPARSLEERRGKQSPLRDVAGMLRSFSYASWTGLKRAAEQRHEDAQAAAGWRELWERASSSTFVRSYLQTMGSNQRLLPPTEVCTSWLRVYQMEKALYELLYELNNRPRWVEIPLAGILALPERSAAARRVG